MEMIQVSNAESCLDVWAMQACDVSKSHPPSFEKPLFTSQQVMIVTHCY